MSVVFSALCDAKMASNDHEQRLAQLEQQVHALQRKIELLGEPKPWWETIAGSFEKDPIYAKAMKLGREYRKSLRPHRSGR
jgi:hypothetical protein